MTYDISQPDDVSVLLIENRDERFGRASVWTGMYRHTSWLMDFSSSDNIRCRVVLPNGTTHEFQRRPRTWHIYAPGTGYYERYADNSMCEMLWFQFSMSRPLAPLTDRPFTVVSDHGERIAQHVRAMYDSQQRGGPGSALIRRGLLLATLGEVLAAAHSGGSGTDTDPWRVTSDQKSSENATLLQRVDACVMQSISSPPSLDEIAQRLNMSVSSLTHRFRAETGMTVVDRVRWLRIREARQLLARRGADVKSVARKLGFSAPSYFSKVFRDITGVTATDYLQRGRK
jgi:AraC-like DNA-binding protein